MSQQDLETVRRIYEGWSRGDFNSRLDQFDPLVLFVLAPDFPDSGTYLGLEELAGYMRTLLEPWKRLTIELEELTAAGDTVLADVHQRGSGISSGAESGFRYQQVWSFRAGKVIRLENFRNRAEALAAAGLSQPSARPST